MKRLKVVQAMSLGDDSPTNLALIKGVMHRQLAAEARRKGLKVGPLKWSEYYASMDGDEDSAAPVTLRVIELTADAQ